MASKSRNHNHDDEASSSRKRHTTYARWSDLDHDVLNIIMMHARWSDLDHDVLNIIMMRLGVTDYFSFRGVCKAWRLYAKESKFMASMPPMSMTIYSRVHEKACHLHDFKGKKFKIILPSFYDGAYFGLTCGFLIFIKKGTRDFKLVNPITRNQLHFPHFPIDFLTGPHNKAILVFSPTISKLVFVVLCWGEIWFSIEGKGAWKRVPYTFHIVDIYAFKGKLYTLRYDRSRHPVVNGLGQLCELRLKPEPKLILLKIRNPSCYKFFGVSTFVSSGDKLYLMDWSGKSLYELDFGEMKWVKPCDRTIEEHAFFFSCTKHVGVAVKRESWADPRSHGIYAASHNNGKISFYTEKMWYFPHQCLNVDRIDE